MSQTKRTIYLVVALLTAIVLAYSHVWHCDFIDYDDNNHVFDNDRVRAGLSLANVLWAVTNFHASQWIPMTWISFMADVSVFGLEPGPMHLVNVAIHGVNTILLFGVLWKMTGAYWRSASVAALFALHPINVETVAWITERKSLINTTFWLLAIACHVRYAAVKEIRWLVFTFMCMALGVMSKAMIVTLPFTLLLLDAWPLRRSFLTPWRRLVLEKVPLFTLTVLVCVIQIRAGMASGLLWPTDIAPMHVRLIGAAANVIYYVAALVYPKKLSIGYPIVYHAPYAMGAIGALGIIALLVLGWRLRASAPYILVGGLWFLGTLVPVSGIVRAGDVVFADRFTYVPQIGLFILVVWSIEALSRPRCRTIAAGVAGAALTILGIATASYVAHWTDTVSLFSHATRMWPDCLRAQELAALAHSKAGDLHGAERHMKATLALAPREARKRNSYGVLLSKFGRNDEAIEQFRQAAADDPALLSARFNLGTHLAEQNGGSAEAVIVLRQVLREDPSLTAAHYWLGRALEVEGRREEARAEYQKRLAQHPRDTSAAAALARLATAS